MNTPFWACVVSLAALSGALHSLPAPAPRANFTLGVALYDDILLYSRYVYTGRIPATVQYEDIIYRNESATISAVQATELGAWEGGEVRLRAGGAGGGLVVLRVQSAAGAGYEYLVQIWGR